MDEKPQSGRPSKYEDHFCEMLIKHMASGLSFETFGAIIEVDRSTLYDWVKEHPEFAAAKSRAFDKCQLHWEKLGLDHVVSVSEHNQEGNSRSSSSKSLNGTVWALNMKNRFKWRERQDEEVDRTIVNNNTYSNMSEEQVDAKLRAWGIDPSTTKPIGETE